MNSKVCILKCLYYINGRHFLETPRSLPNHIWVLLLIIVGGFEGEIETKATRWALSRAQTHALQAL